MAEDQKMGVSDFHRITAAFCNNEAWSLLETPELDAAQTARLVTLAGAARHHWHEVGTASNVAHADLLFGWALARAGAGDAAREAARTALEFFNAEGSAWERAFAEAAVAAACRASGDDEGFARHYGQAEALGRELDEDDEMNFQAAFRTLD